jgi:hypothetical protein
LALDVWSFFGGEIQWNAVPWVAELHGCNDLDTLCALLVGIRNHRAQAMRDA